ncbi:trypsin-like peptidase [Aquimarina sp. MAR_2010_214]|uniref:trypsin-like serine peptidase n=1 Tax=Aquimarina sp. MAR_2010_214 TaxID=1250026 RepID=UPI000C709A26|nr:serine protease [Aquimarina sp. MAR_2010_214]PKV51900.1 trypsin-like peptidase [Aquimarina sp. MAR_2010_214]
MRNIVTVLLLLFGFSAFCQTKSDSIQKMDSLLKKKEVNKIIEELEFKKKATLKNKNFKIQNLEFNSIQKNKIIDLKEAQKKIDLQEIQKINEIEGLQEVEELVIKSTSIPFQQEALYIGEDELEGYNNDINGTPRLHGPSQFDSRIELRELNPDIDWQWLILRRNESVGIIIEKEKINKISEDIYQLDISNSLERTYNLCSNIPFRTQPTVGIGTTFIIGENEMITANHVFNKKLEDYVIVFGFEMLNKNGIIQTVINVKDIYYPQKKIYNSEIYDVVIYELDRPVKRPVLEWKRSSSLKEGNEIYMIGHPSGIPKKIAVNASVIKNSHDQYFYTSLDSFQGNSGSPVFDFNTHKVIGVLVSGELDYTFNGNCNELNLCKYPYCKGEKVIRIENIMNNRY